MLPESFILVSVALNILSGLSYLIAMRKGLARPNQVTWALWALAPLIGSAAQIASGVGWPVLLVFGTGLVPLAVLLYSFKTGHEPWALTPFDYVCGLISLSGIIAWVLTQSPFYALILSIVADGFATWPTLTKAYTHPETEDSRTYIVSSIGIAFAFLTFPNFTFVTIGFAIYMLLVNFILSLLTYFPHIRLSLRKT